jgi:hypothetical protein
METLTILRPPRLSDITIAPAFRDPKTMSQEELTDPDYRLKSLQKEYGGNFNISCSRCHHCK